MAKRRTHNEFVEEMKVLHPDVEVIGEYDSSKANILVKDKFGILNGNIQSLMKGKPIGVKSAVNKTEYFRNQLLLVNPNIELLDEYERLDRKVLIRDRYGFALVYPKVILRGHGITSEVALDKSEYFKGRMKHISPEINIIGDYIKANDKLLVSDNFGLCSMKPHTLLMGFKTGMSSAINRTYYWISMAKSKHGDTFDYSKTIYVNDRTDLIIICPIHGEFKTKPSNHIQSEYGCGRCGQDKINYAKSTPIDKIIEDAKDTHGNRFDYSETKFVNDDDEIYVICKIHGGFWIKAVKHVYKYVCPECAIDTMGYSRSEFIRKANGIMCVMYKIKCTHGDESFYKIGITSNSIKQRFMRSGFKYNYIILSEIHGDAEYIWNLEKIEHRYHKKFKYNPLIEFGGDTECFTKLL